MLNEEICKDISTLIEESAVQRAFQSVYSLMYFSMPIEISKEERSLKFVESALATSATVDEAKHSK